MANRNRTFNGNEYPLPANIEARLARFTRAGSLHVARMRHACDLWVGAVEGRGNPWGRGAFFWTDPATGRKVKQSAAAIMYRIHRLGGAAIPAGMCVNHACDVESCVNPDHLYLGTRQMSGSDLHRRGAAADQGVVEEAVNAHFNLFLLGERRMAPWLERANRLRGVGA